MPKPLTIVLILAAAFLAIIIVTKGIGDFNVSKEGTEKTMQPSIDCVGYIYSITAIKYDQESKQLDFTFENKQYGDMDVSAITVNSDRNSTQTVNRQLLKGMKGELSLKNFDMDKNFTAYPDNCIITAKTCVIATGDCSSYEPGSYE